MMKLFGFSVLFMVVGTTFMVLASITSADINFPESGSIEIAATLCNRKLKQDMTYKSNNTIKKKVVENFNLDDYHPVDPVPSSKATITNGPIEHGTPLMPYIPKLTPPRHGP